MKKLKKIIYIILGVFVLSLFVLLFISWTKTNDNDASIYKYNRTWTYSVAITNEIGDVVDSFSMSMNTKKPSILERILGNIVLGYSYQRGETNSEGKRVGITDNNNHIYIPTPTDSPLGYTNVPPKPSFNKTKLTKNSWSKEQSDGSSKAMNVPSYTDKRQNREINIDGKNIEYSWEISDTTTLNYHGKELFCYIQDGKNTNHINELGQFRSRYFFNEQYGIIKWIYDTPWNETTTITLQETNF